MAERSAAGEGARRRGRPPSLSDAAVVDAALRLTQQVGLESVAMRSLARELDVPPMTLYSYVPNVEALRRMVADHLLAPVQVPGPDTGTWEARLCQLERDVRRALAAHPGVSAQLRSGGSSEGRRLAEGVLSILRDGGFDGDDAVLCFVTLFTFMLGQIDLDSMVDPARPWGEETVGSIAGTARFTRDEMFEFGFAAVVAGLRASLRR